MAPSYYVPILLLLHGVPFAGRGSAVLARPLMACERPLLICIYYVDNACASVTAPSIERHLQRVLRVCSGIAVVAASIQCFYIAS